MATITTATYLDSAARTAGEAMTINSGGQLTIRTDTRVHANAPASMTGYLGAVTINEGKCIIDAQNVRWLAYNTGTGNVPAIGTTISQGGVSGYLLGVWASLTSAPTAAAAAMPATGFIKFREVTGGAFAAGALTGIGASATGADVAGWMEVVFGGVDITVLRLGEFRTRGAWFYLDNTTGARGQVVQVPTNGGGANTYCPGVWVETAPSSGVYEQWPALNGATNGWDVRYTGAAEGQTDARHKFVKMLSNGQMQFGETVTFASTYASVAAQASTYVSWAWAATYTLTGNVCTVYTAGGHGMYGGETLGFDFTSGTATDQIGTITVIDAYYFTVPITNADTSGNVTVRAGATVTFTAHGLQEGNQVGLTVSTGTLPTTTTYTVHSVASANSYNILYPHTTALTSGNCSALHTLQVTRTSHGHAIGNQVYLDFTSGGATDGVYTMRAVATNTFNVNFPHYAAITTSNVTERYELGKVPAAGCKVRIPNIFVRNATTASNNIPNATLASRPEFITTSAGAIDCEYLYAENLYCRFGQAYSVRLVHAAIMETLEITECASPLDVDDVFIGNYTGANTITPLTITTCNSGGSIKNSRFFRAGTPNSGLFAANTTASSGITFDSVEAGILLYARNANAFFWFEVCSALALINTRSYNTELRLSTCTSTTVTNHDHVDRLSGLTNATTGLYAVSNRIGNGNTISNVTFGFGGTIQNVHPYAGLILGDYSKNSNYRNCGTYDTPLNGGTWEPSLYNMAVLYSSGLGNASGIKVQRMYGTRLRVNAPLLQLNSDKNIVFETLITKEAFAHSVSTIANRLNIVMPQTLNAVYRGVTGVATTTGQASVYGTHFMSTFMGGAYGQIALCMNEPTPETAGYFTMVSGTAKFNSSGGILMGVIGNQAVWETQDWIIGHTGFINAAATMSGGTIGNYTLEYQIDTGSGYSAWKTLDGTNLSGETVSPATGFKLKIRITTTSTDTTAITYLTLGTTTTEAAQRDNLYPLDTATVSMVGLINDSRVKASKVSDGTVLFNGAAPSGTVSFSTDYIGDIRLEARKASAAPYYKPYVTQVTSVSGSTVTATALQERDDQ